jgi:beta-mannosidase
MLTLCVAGFAQSVVSLNGKWELSFWEQPAEAVRTVEALQKVKYQTIAATVPGNVELDLLAAGLIHDPMVGNNLWEMRPYEGYQWCYSRTFPAPACKDGQQVLLHFGGIDCLADILLNGESIASTDNMLIDHTFDVTRLLKQHQENTLKVILRSAVLEAQRYLLNPLGVRGNSANAE